MSYTIIEGTCNKHQWLSTHVLHLSITLIAKIFVGIILLDGYDCSKFKCSNMYNCSNSIKNETKSTYDNFYGKILTLLAYNMSQCNLTEGTHSQTSLQHNTIYRNTLNKHHLATLFTHSFLQLTPCMQSLHEALHFVQKSQ